MKNLNRYGKKHLSKFLLDYSQGKLSFAAAKLYIGSCFDVRVIYK